MSRALKWTPDAWEDYVYWQSEDRKILKKINMLIKQACRTPEEGAEPLRGNLSGCFSRHITKKDVLVYAYDENLLTVLQCRYHYTDK